MTEPSYPPYPPPGYGPPQYGYAGPPADPPAAATPQRPARSGPGRILLITLLVCAGAVLTGAGAPAVWSRATLLGTDRFVDTLAPLASDDGVQELVITTVSTRITSSLGSIGGPLSGVVDTVVSRVVTGPEFPGLWRSICRAAHPGVVTVLTGRSTGGAVSTSDGRLTLDVGPVIGYVKQQLQRVGVPVGGLPTSGVLVSVADLPSLDPLQALVRFVDAVAWWLLGFAVIAFGVAIAVARGRLRVVQVSGVLIALAMLVDLLIVSGVKSVAVDRAGGLIGDTTAGDAFDTVVHSLRADLVIVLVVALVVAAGAFVAEPLTRRARPTR